MMDELYQDILLDHAKSPRRYGELEGPCICSTGHNPLCGDEIVLRIRMEDDVIEEARFTSSGCAISTAAASLIVDAAVGMKRRDVLALCDRVHHALTSQSDEPLPEEFEALRGVRRFPMRVKCATLALHTLRDAIDQAQSTA